MNPMMNVSHMTSFVLSPFVLFVFFVAKKGFYHV
jgi:hypothetical protein